jgi:signal peptidase I
LSKKQEIDFKGVSMSPLLHDGDKIFVDIKESSFELGQIIVVMDNNHELICHRVISLNPIQTKGDRNLYIDQTQSVVGVVTHVKKKGETLGICTNKTLNIFQAYLNRMNNNENQFRKIALLILYFISLYELKTSKESVEHHTPKLEK